METVKLTTISNGGLLNQPYGSGNTPSVSFSTCSEIKRGAAKMLTGFYFCREGVIGEFARFFDESSDKTRVGEISGDGDSKKALYNYADMPIKRTSVAIHINVGKKSKVYINNFGNWIERSVKLLNHYERRNKWFLSRSYEVDHDAGEADLIYLFKSSRWWMTSPHTLSLYLLLIRLGTYEFFGEVKKSTSNTEVLSLIRKILPDDNDYRHVTSGMPEKWNILLDNRKKIYEEKKPEKTFTFDKSCTSVKVDGIRALCLNESCDEATTKRFNELCKEAGLKIPGR